MMVGITQTQLDSLKDIIEIYDHYGPNRKYENGETVAERLLSTARETVKGAVDGAQSFGDSLKLDMIEKWTRTGRMDLAKKLAEGLRAGKPIRTAIEEAHNAAS